MPEVIFTGPAGRIEGRYHPSKTKGAPIELSPRSAEIIGMALHELSTNAVKYGALSVDGGEVQRSVLLEGVVALLAVASVITVVQRFVYVYRHADDVKEPSRARDAGVPLDSFAKGR